MTESSIHPFRIEVPQAAVDDLRRRLADTRWPLVSPVSDWSRGIPADRLRELATAWAEAFDWRKQEAALNDLPHFVTEIDGQPIHFLHVRSPEAGATPLLLSHGYPSSVLEFLDVIGPLSDPASYGGDPADACHLVFPSLPGFAWSSPLTSPGWTMARTARAWVELMRRLGYQRYAAHGSDIGSGITGMLSGIAPAAVIATHIASDPASTAAVVGEFVPLDMDSLTPEDRSLLASWKADVKESGGYLALQSTHPQTLTYALADSPVFQLAWLAEPFHDWTQSDDTRPDGIDRDRLLTMASVYWFTGCGASAAHVLYENAHSHEWIPPGDAPQGWAVFGSDPLVRRLMDPGHEIAHWSEFDRGGHFPALEVPDLLVEDLRRFLRGLS
jgi:pimeloyl-ACP methyl ester carboxylesterase